MGHMPYYLNRYFWFANVFLWLAIHGLFVHVEFNSAQESGSEISWISTWVFMSPWYFNWIWVTAGIFALIYRNEKSDRSYIRRLCSYISGMILLLVCYWALCVFIGTLIRGQSFSEYWRVFTTVVSNSFQIDILIYFSVLTLGFAIRFYHTSINESTELKQLKYELTQEQLRTLRSQLNPHFLFNALNTIASLVRLKREKDAVHALSELSFMLRKILDNKNQVNVKIKEEINFINSYLSIQKMRFSDKLNTHISVQPECLELKIPNMILHPLVENAVSHGSQLESNNNILNLEISRNMNELQIVMTNKVAKHDAHNGFGIGLRNTRERLSKTYKDFKLETNQMDNELYQTSLIIPLGEFDA